MKKEFRVSVHKKFNGRCAYCGNILAYKDMQLDHILAKNKGGGNDFSNLNPSCRSCNFYKGTFAVEEFRSNLNSLTERLNKIFIFRLALKYRIIKINDSKILFHFEKKNHERK